MIESIAIILLGSAAFLAIFNPLVGLYGFLFVTYIRPQDYFHFLKVGVEPAKWVLVITLISFVLQRFREWVGVVRAKQNWGILAILLCVYISKANAIDHNLWWSATRDFIEVCLVYFLIINIVNTPKKLRYFYLFFLLINVMIAFRFFHAYHGGTAGTSGGKPGDTSLGFLSNADDLGIGMAMALAFAVPAVFFARGLILKALAFFASGGLIWAVMATESRGARIGLLAAFITTLIFQLKPRKFKSKGFLAGLLIALLLLGGFVYKYRWALKESINSTQNMEDSGRIGREATWHVAKRMIRENPLTGVGRGNYIPYWRENYPPGIYNYQLAHNIIYEVTAETGVLGLCAFLFFSLIGLWEFIGIRKKYRDVLRKNYFLDMIFTVYLAGLAVFYLNGMFITVAFYWHIYILVAMFVCAKNILARQALVLNENTKIKLMHVCYSLSTGGLEQLVLDLVKNTDRNKFIPSVCCLTGETVFSGEFAKNDIPVFYFNKKEGLDFRLAFKLARLFKKEKIDIIHTHDSTPNLYASLGAKLAGVKAVINTEHGGIFFETSRLKAINQFLSTLNFKMVCVSEKVKDDLEAMGIGKKKLLVIQNGIDLGKYDIQLDRNAKRAQLGGLSGEDFVICTVGRLCKLKNQKMLLDSAKYIFQAIPQARLIIAGDGPLRGELENYAKELDIAQKVAFLGTRYDVPEILKISDCFVLCSDYESFGLVILEAMLCGVPVVATDVGGVGEILEDEVTGKLIPRGDVKALTDAVIRIKNDPEYFRSIAARARENVVHDYGIDKVVRAYERVYLDAANN